MTERRENGPTNQAPDRRWLVSSDALAELDLPPPIVQNNGLITVSVDERTFGVSVQALPPQHPEGSVFWKDRQERLGADGMYHTVKLKIRPPESVQTDRGLLGIHPHVV